MLAYQRRMHLKDRYDHFIFEYAMDNAKRIIPMFLQYDSGYFNSSSCIVHGLRHSQLVKQSWLDFSMKSFYSRRRKFGVSNSTSFTRLFPKVEKYLLKEVNHRRYLLRQHRKPLVEMLQERFRESYNPYIERFIKMYWPLKRQKILRRNLKRYTLLKKHRRQHFTKSEELSVEHEQPIRVADTAAAAAGVRNYKLQNNHLQSRFSGLLTKKGKGFRAEKITNRVKYLLKVGCLGFFRRSTHIIRKKLKSKLTEKHYFSRDQLLFLTLTQIRPALSLRRQGKGKAFFDSPARLSIQRSISLAQRNLLRVSRRSNSVSQKIASELVDIYRKKPTTSVANLTSLVQELYDSRAFV